MMCGMCGDREAKGLSGGGSSAMVAGHCSVAEPPMTSQEKAFHQFATFAAKLKGDEKSEAQTFLFHLLAAFGHDPNTLPESSTFEYRVARGSTLKGDQNYTSDTVFDTFPWPQSPCVRYAARP